MAAGNISHTNETLLVSKPDTFSLPIISQVCVTIAVIELILNGLVLKCLILHQRRKGSSPLLKQLFIININDIISPFAMIIVGLLNSKTLTSNSYMCAVWLTLILVTQSASLLTFTLIGLLRLNSVIKLRQKRHQEAVNSSRMLALSMVCIWTVCLLWHGAVLAMFGKFDTPLRKCTYSVLFGDLNLQTGLNYLHIPRLAAIFVVNTIYLVIMYTLKPREHRRTCKNGNDATATTSQTNTMSCSSSSGDAETRTGTEKDTYNNAIEKTRKTQMRGVLSVFFLVISLNVASLPYLIMQFLRRGFGLEVPLVLSRLAYFLFTLHSFFDPFVYCWRIKHIRISMKETLTKMFCKVCTSNEIRP